MILPRKWEMENCDCGNFNDFFNNLASIVVCNEHVIDFRNNGTENLILKIGH